VVLKHEIRQHCSPKHCHFGSHTHLQSADRSGVISLNFQKLFSRGRGCFARGDRKAVSDLRVSLKGKSKEPQLTHSEIATGPGPGTPGAVG
jgi:hypothetical protein